MKIVTTTKRVLLLPLIVLIALGVWGVSSQSSPSQVDAASSATTSTLLPQIQNVDWDTIPTTTTSPPPVIKKAPAPSRPTAPRASRSRPQGAGCAHPSANPHAPRANCSGCESSTTQSVNPSGKYWGKYQFDRKTWESNGGDPSAYGSANEDEQDRVASHVTYDAWPHC